MSFLHITVSPYIIYKEVRTQVANHSEQLPSCKSEPNSRSKTPSVRVFGDNIRAFGVFDCDFDFGSQEWNCSSPLSNSNPAPFRRSHITHTPFEVRVFYFRSTAHCSSLSMQAAPKDAFFFRFLVTKKVAAAWRGMGHTAVLPAAPHSTQSPRCVTVAARRVLLWR